MNLRELLWLVAVWLFACTIGLFASIVGAESTTDEGAFPDVQIGFGDRAGDGSPGLPEDTVQAFGCGVRYRCVTWEEIDPPYIFECLQCWYTCYGPIYECSVAGGRAVAGTLTGVGLLDSIASASEVQ